MDSDLAWVNGKSAIVCWRFRALCRPNIRSHLPFFCLWPEQPSLCRNHRRLSVITWWRVYLGLLSYWAGARSEQGVRGDADELVSWPDKLIFTDLLNTRYFVRHSSYSVLHPAAIWCAVIMPVLLCTIFSRQSYHTIPHYIDRVNITTFCKYCVDMMSKLKYRYVESTHHYFQQLQNEVQNLLVTFANA